MRAILCGLVLSVALGASLQARAAGVGDEGRQHARKASRLSSTGKCRQAVREYTIAYQLLRDPALLFNRAECLRKLGERDLALADYREFITAMPTAPSRKLVEARIVELDPSAVVEASAPAPEASAPAPEVKAPVPEVKPPEVQAAVPEVPATPVAVPESAPAAEAAPEPAAPLATPSFPAIPRLRLDERAGPEPAERPRSKGVSGWVWFGAAVAVLAAGATAGWLLYGRTRTDVPTSSLGNYRF